MAEDRRWEEGGEEEEEEGEPSPFVEQTAPVLPVNIPLTEHPGSTTPSTASSGATATGSITTTSQSHDPGASELWGLSEEIDKWQVSSMPEERQYFAMDVSRATQLQPTSTQYI